MALNNDKQFIHSGAPLIIIISLIIVFFIVLLVRLAAINNLFYIYLLIILVLLFSILSIYKITITISNTYLSFKLGIGLIKKQYEIAKIKSCKPVSNISKRIGIGTKVSFNGDVLEYYIVTGFKAIEVQFYDRKTIVHIGTKQPYEISRMIQILIKLHNFE